MGAEQTLSIGKGFVPLPSFTILRGLNRILYNLSIRRAALTPPPPTLSTAQIEAYWRDGFLNGIPVLSEAQMSVARRKLVELETHEIVEDADRWVNPDYCPWATPGSAWWHWFQGMARHPTIVGAVRCLLGPNVLIRNADIFVKPVGSPVAIRWHTDTTADDRDADKMLTAWLAVSQSSLTNGCMEWLTGSHRQPLPPEVKDKFSLSFNESSEQAVEHAPRCANILAPGELSLHHFRTIHRSGNNREAEPRIGLVIRFMASDTPIAVAETERGTLVAGDNTPGHFRNQRQFPVSWNKRSHVPQLRVIQGESRGP